MSDYPHQARNAARIVELLRSGRNAGDWSETGTGKTFTAMRTMRDAPAPSLVVCPKISISSWERAGEMSGTEFSVVNWEALRYGNTPFGWWERKARGGFRWVRAPQLVERDLKGTWWYRFRLHPAVRRVYWDEFHRAKGYDSYNATMVKGATDQKLQQVMITATPAADPTEMRALGTALGWFEWEGWRRWALANGCWCPMVGGIKFTDTGAAAAAVLDPIRRRMLECGVKTGLREIQPEHGLVVAPRLIDVDERTLAEVTALWGRAAELDAALRLKEVNARNLLAERVAIRQRLELIKLKAVHELALDRLAEGCTVLAFFQYRATLDAYAELFPDAGMIHGDVKQSERDRVMREVRDGNMRNVGLQSAAGGESISLQDVSGERPVVQLVTPPDSAQQLIQLAGRSDRLGSRSTPVMVPLFVAKSLEEKVWRKVSAKAQRIKDLTDADLAPI